MDFPLLNSMKISKNLPHEIGHNFKAHATLLKKKEDKIGHFCAVSPMKVSTRVGVYETLCPQHMLVPKDNLIKNAKVKKGR